MEEVEGEGDCSASWSLFPSSSSLPGGPSLLSSSVLCLWSLGCSWITCGLGKDAGEDVVGWNERVWGCGGVGLQG